MWIIKDRFHYEYYAANGLWTQRQSAATRFMMRYAAKKALDEVMSDRPEGMPRARIVRLRTTEAPPTK